MTKNQVTICGTSDGQPWKMVYTGTKDKDSVIEFFKSAYPEKDIESVEVEENVDGF